MPDMRSIIHISLILLLCISSSLAQRNRIEPWQLRYAPDAGYVLFSGQNGEYNHASLSALISGTQIDTIFIENDTLFFIFSNQDTIFTPINFEVGSGIDTAFVQADSLYIVTTTQDTINAGYVVGPAGSPGTPGANGSDGANGADGQDGVGIDTAFVSLDSLYILLSNTTLINTGHVRGPQGIQGVPGTPGANGANGADGQDGVGVDTAFVNIDTLYVILTTGDTINTGYVRGPQGIQGVPGTPGANGADGQDGANGADGVGIDTVFIATDSLYVVLTSQDTINAGYIPGASGGDNWGTQVVETDATLTGTGIIGNLLKVDTTLIATQYYVTSQGYTTNTGTVTSVGGTGTVNGITLSGTVTNSGNLTLGGTLSGVDLTSQITGTLPVGNGGTGATSLTGVLIGNGTSVFSGITGTASQLLRRNASNTAFEFFTHNFLTANQTITLSGDVTGSGATAITTTIATNAVSNAKFRQSVGRSVVGRSANSTGNVADIVAGGDNQFLVTRAGDLGFGSLTATDIPDISATYYLASNPSGFTSNVGTVTSVGLSLPSIFNVSGSPITGAGTLTGSLANQNANLIFAGPTSGGAAAPTFRSLVSNDIPSLDMAKITTGNLAWSRISSTPTTLSGYGITDAVASTRQVNTSGSLTGGGDLTANRTLSLVNDNATPGNTKYYGTDGSGTKGWYDIPGASGGEANTASNVGGAYGLFKQKSGIDLQFKTLIPGYGITIDSTADNITINRREYMEPWDTTATTYILTLSDAQRGVIFTSASNVQCTIPPNSSVAYSVGQLIHITRYGTGEVEFVAGSGVTLNSASGFKRIANRYQTATLWQVATNEWILISDLKN
jgi:hypothetical protein